MQIAAIRSAIPPEQGTGLHESWDWCEYYALAVTTFENSSLRQAVKIRAYTTRRAVSLRGKLGNEEPYRPFGDDIFECTGTGVNLATYYIPLF